MLHCLTIEDLKIIILGMGRVGKTSFLYRYIHDEFAETISTIGASFILKKWKSFYFGIWDTAGQERFAKISSFYSRGAQAAIVAFDLTDRTAFDSIEHYISLLQNSEKDCFIVIIGTKADLVAGNPESRRVSSDEGSALAQKYRAPYFETSAKSNINVQTVFDTIGYHCLATKLSSMPHSPSAAVSPKIRGGSAADPSDRSDNRVCCAIQ